MRGRRPAFHSASKRSQAASTRPATDSDGSAEGMGPSAMGEPWSADGGPPASRSVHCKRRRPPDSHSHFFPGTDSPGPFRLPAESNQVQLPLDLALGAVLHPGDLAVAVAEQAEDGELAQ